MTSDYHTSRFKFDQRRSVLWKTLWTHYFKAIVPHDGCVLDLGCGYGDFINQVVARRRIALDMWDGFPSYLAPGVEPVVASVTDLGGIPDAGVDFAFASNLFEHITQGEFAQVLASLRRKLSSRGTLTIIQPNYRFAYKEYFDDYTHISVYSHISLVDFLTVNGYEIIEVAPRFLPLTIKSGYPVHPALIAAYLRSPLKPLGKQMLVRARPKPDPGL